MQVWHEAMILSNIPPNNISNEEQNEEKKMKNNHVDTFI
jgi:hypothetical protein